MFGNNQSVNQITYVWSQITNFNAFKGSCYLDRSTIKSFDSNFEVICSNFKSRYK